MPKPPMETVRVNKRGRDQLIKLKRQTRIENWNTLCRWALCVSIKDLNQPPPFDEKMEGGVEMSWKVFSGDYSELFVAILIWRCQTDGIEISAENLSHCFRIHVHRGLDYLSAGMGKETLVSFARRWLVTTPSIDS